MVLAMAASLLRNRSAFVHIVLLLLLIGAWHSAEAEQNYLEPERAFQLSARMLDVHTAEINYTIAPGYHMYRERFQFSADGASLGAPVFPQGEVKFDDTFQKDVETYHNTAVITLPVQAGGSFVLHVTSQGCADEGLCYAPMTTALTLSPTSAGTTQSGNTRVPDSSAAGSDAMGIGAALQSGRLLAILPLFFLLGLGLAFTPCMLPMMPILSSVIVGSGSAITRRRGLLLSATYAIGMALVYTLFGIAAGLAGQGLAASLQNPFVLGAFALLMVALALSMFGWYQLQVPAWMQSHLSQLSSRRTSGKLAGVFAMGAISALIVGPCMAAPLAGALLYISQTRDVFIGGSALFAMALGISMPLLLIGVSAGTLLPRAGPWMGSVKHLFGVILLAVALWMVAPLLARPVLLLGWALLGIGYGACLTFRWSQSGWLARSAGVLFLLIGVMEGAGAVSGATDPLLPLAGFYTNTSPNALPFMRVNSVAELDAKLAHLEGRRAMLDFYADWCVSCQEMEKRTFSTPAIQHQLSDMVLLQADVTANNADDQTLLRRYHLFGPPGIIFFASSGLEVPQTRVVGYQDAEKFAQSMQRAKQ